MVTRVGRARSTRSRSTRPTSAGASGRGLHRAAEYAGELVVDDPDGIVVDARWVHRDACAGAPLAGAPVGGRAAGRVARRALGRAAPLRLPHRRRRRCAPGLGEPSRRRRDRAVDRDRAPILHVDMDAFFVSVELLRQPELRGQPGGRRRHGRPRASWRPRRTRPGAYGVHSAMPSVAGAAPVPARGVPRRATTPLRRGQRAGDGDLPVVHAAGRAALARRGLPRRHRRTPRCSAPAPRSPPHIRAAGPRRGGPDLLGRAWRPPSSSPSWRREAAKPQASTRPAAPPGPGRGRGARPAASSRSCTRSRSRRCGASGPATLAEAGAHRRDDGRRPGRPARGRLVARARRRRPGRHLHALAHGHRRPAGRARPAAQVGRPRGDLRPRPPRA